MECNKYYWPEELNYSINNVHPKYELLESNLVGKFLENIKKFNKSQILF